MFVGGLSRHFRLIVVLLTPAACLTQSAAVIGRPMGVKNLEVVLATSPRPGRRSACRPRYRDQERPALGSIWGRVVVWTREWRRRRQESRTWGPPDESAWAQRSRRPPDRGLLEAYETGENLKPS